jgi:glutathione reductase (NADPH)
VVATHDYDLFVIGGGSGGVRAARIAAGYGARVGIADEYRYGGTCVIRGCVPKKLFVHAAEVKKQLADAAGFGWEIGDSRFDWGTLVANKDAEIARLNRIYEDLLARAKVDVHHARASFLDPHTLQVGERRVTAAHVLIATGGLPFLPATPGIEHAISSNEAFQLARLEPTIAVVGGGYIAVEFACIFQQLGSRVTLVYRRDRVLRGFDDDVRQAVTDNLRLLGVELVLDATITAIEQRERGLGLRLDTGSELEAGTVLYATGRVPNTDRLGLERAGVASSANGAISVDEYSRSNVGHIYAVGDVTDRIALTPVAIREGHAVADSLFGGKPTAVDHTLVPTAVFCQPSAAAVGLTEAEARVRHGHVDVYITHFRPLKHTLSGAPDKVMMKLVVDPATDRLLGAHMVGDGAAEIIQVMAVAVRAGLTKAQLDATTALHPTTAEELVLMRSKRA